MKITFSSKKGSAFSLITSLIFLGMASATLGSLLLWTTQTAVLAQRNNEYHTSLYVAESVYQKVRSSLVTTYDNFGEPAVWLRLTTYPPMLPVGSNDTLSATYGLPNNIGGGSVWNSYQYVNPADSTKTAKVVKSGTNITIQLDPPYSGLTAMASKYQVITTVINTNSRYKVPINVGIEMTLGNIPLFQFALFSEGDLEIAPGATMVVGGVVHGNSDIYATGSLTFSNDVSSTGNIFATRKPGDPSGASGTAVYLGNKITNAPYQHLPTGTNQVDAVTDQAANVHAILDIPDDSEPYGYNTVGTNRYYNKADLIIKITDSGVQAYSARYRGNSTLLTNFSANIINTNDTFYDQREGSTMQASALDVGKLKAYLESTNSLQLSSLLGGSNVSTVYIADLRTTYNTVVSTNNVTVTNGYSTNILSTRVTATTYTLPATYVPNSIAFTSGSTTTTTTVPATNAFIPSSFSYNSTSKKYTYTKFTSYTYSYTNIATQLGTNTVYTTNFPTFAKPAIVLTNGITLPANGLTIATLDPVYIRGDYNVSTDGVNVYKATADTSHTRPASVLSDAITILSTNFTAANSSNSLSYRTAAQTTVNAGLMAGNVPTVSGHYSGGIENFTRFLENWSGKNFYYNGSMVLMYPSQIATGYWPGTGTVYNPPTRYWTFDYNFIGGKLPPSSPSVNSFARGKWRVLAPGATTVQ